jgi:hypothetical protein
MACKELILINIIHESKHGWGAQKDCFILYSLDPLI